jgi:hypothetical protein
MADHSRRAVVGGGLRASFAAVGGLLLPTSVRATVVSDWPAVPSADLLDLRANLAGRAILYAEENTDLNQAQRILSRVDYADKAQVILDRPADSWQQIAELAEVAWALWPKIWYGPMPPDVTLDLQCRQNRHWNSAGEAAAAQLIHAVVKMTRGQRFSPLHPDAPILEERLSDAGLTDLCTGGANG